MRASHIMPLSLLLLAMACHKDEGTTWRNVTVLGDQTTAASFGPNERVTIEGDLAFLYEGNDAGLVIRGEVEFRLAEGATCKLPPMILLEDDAHLVVKRLGAGPWYSLKYEHAEGTLALDNVDIEGGQIGLEIRAAQRVMLSRLTMDENEIYSIYCDNVARAEIEDLTIMNSQYGLYCSNNVDSLIMTRFTISNCEIGIYNIRSGMIIDNGEISHCSNVGLYCHGEDFLHATYIDFYANFYHIYERQRNDLNITYCDFAGQERYVIYFHSALYGRNNIRQNNISNEANFVKVVSGTVDVTENYWGTTQDDVIAGRMIDHRVETQLGTINYLPFLIMPVANAGRAD
ncbi:MAG: NosD domain-containing protein [bacterium]|nr:NosD domain-containing protein [bacterium]